MKHLTASWSRQRWLMVVGVVLVVFFAANAHLVMVSFRSMPACVAPADGDQSAMLRVAKPAC